MEWLICFFLLFIFSFWENVSTHEKSQDRESDYKNCPTGEVDKLNVHLICHTHLDVGWLKTVNQYYFGANSETQRAGVQYIISSVILNLRHYPERKFIFAESAFFSKWWRDQPDNVRQQVTDLVNNGQIEFVGGGWSMHDEAAVHYNSVIDQMTHGLRFLKDTFGEFGVPKVAWQIDPFGHTKEQASMFAQMNFDGLFFGRYDRHEQEVRRINKTQELVWEPSRNLGARSQLFTSPLHNLYQPPPGFCFDIMCRDEPIVDNHTSKNYNLDLKVADFIAAAENQAEAYATNHIAITMGSDFHYQSAAAWFKNLDKLILHVNKQKNNGSRVNVFYSNPACYLFALYKTDKTWPSKTDDFIPYNSEIHAYWTGFYTSRPELKRLERIGNNKLQVCKQLAAIANIPEDEASLEFMKEAMGILQHHDAITGTAKQPVANDYKLVLESAIETCHNVIKKAYRKNSPKDKTEPPLGQHFCNSLSISQCNISETNSPISITFYNPLAWNVSKYIHIPVTGSAYSVIDYRGEEVNTQLINISSTVLEFAGRNSSAHLEIAFKVKLPPLGYATYLVNPSTSTEITEKMRSSSILDKTEEDRIIKNKFITVFVDGKSGLLKKLQLADDSVLLINQSFHWYPGMNGDNQLVTTRASGAYIFRPNGTTPLPLGNDVKVTLLKGSVVQEIRQIFQPWLSQIIRLYENSQHVELEWIVGPIPVDDEVGKEIVTRFDTDIQSDDIFYTDSNGREMVKRKRDYRSTYEWTGLEPVAGNYYPVTSRIYIKDAKTSKQFTVLNDRAQGGSSLKSGSIEIMIHRRLLLDDGFGMQEALNEPGVDGKGLVVRGSHYLLFSDVSSSASKHRPLAHSLFLQPQLSFATHILTDESYIKNYNMMVSELKEAFPPNVHLLTLEPWKNGTILIRLEHIYELDEDPELSKPVTVSLEDRFNHFKITSLEETTLSANLHLADAKRLCWKAEHLDSLCDATQFRSSQNSLIDISKIDLKPMEIRTFIATITR